ncbi:hypothetical protein U1839_18795 [Sphingomonas sp. RT2P30]|uniref:hypothetical protein n=1 Tax=Parasphingomonas halimpatiens TaxID=3096162 RepID=UPI002FC9BF82
MIRKILAIVAGLVAAFLIILLVEGVDERLYPVPADLDTTDAAALGAYVFAMPMAAKLLVVGGWLLGALGGVWLCLRISDRRWTGWIIVLLLIAGGVANMIQFGHPLWMQAGAVIAPLLGGWIGARLHPRPYPGEPLLG